MIISRGFPGEWSSPAFRWRRSFHAQILFFAILARRPKCDLTKTAVSVVVAAYSGVEMSLWNVLSNASAFCALGRILLIGETIELPLGSPYKSMEQNGM